MLYFKGWKAILPQELKTKEVKCPRCGALVGFEIDEPSEKIEKIRLTIGNKEYPTVDVDKLGELKLWCSACGYEWVPKKKIADKAN